MAETHISVFVPTVGDIRFLDILWESHEKNTKMPTDWFFMLDVPRAKNVEAMYRFAQGRGYVILDDRNLGLNAMWTRCVKIADLLGYGICCVLNDDIWLTPGWLEMVNHVLTMNTNVALCGIPCDDQTLFAKGNNVRERWFDDRELFTDDFERFRTTPVKLEPWTAGMLWATKPRDWLQIIAIDPGLWWGYGEMYMGIKLYELGYDVASIYYPCIFHYGGGMNQPDVTARQPPMQDGERFSELFGTGHAHLLLEQWELAQKANDGASVRCDPEIVEHVNALLQGR